MKNILFCIALTACCFQIGHSQFPRIDSTYSVDGKIVSTLSTGSQNYGTAIQVLPGGEVLACGHPIGSPATKLSVEKFLADGQSDSGFDFVGHPAFQGYGTVIGLQDDGKILCAFRTGLVRHLPDGSVDNTFGTNGFVPNVPNFDPSKIINLPNGKIALVGDRNDDPTLGYVFRVYNPNGSFDSTFSGDGKLDYKYGPGVGYISNGMVLADGKLLIAGDYYLGSEVKFTLLRLTPEGEFDPEFGTNGFITDVVSGYNQISGMAIQPDGKIVVTGYMGFPKKMILLRYLPNGTRDSDFGVDGLQVSEGEFERRGVDVKVREDGKILVLAKIDTAALSPLLGLLQFNADGTLDSSFGNSGLFQSDIGCSFFGPCTMFATDDNTVVVGTRSNLNNGPLIIARFLLDMDLGFLDHEMDLLHHTLVYPNPIEDNFTLSFELATPERIGFDLYNMNGKRLESFRRERYFDSGLHEVPFRLRPEMPSGNYALVISIQGKPVSSIQISKK